MNNLLRVDLSVDRDNLEESLFQIYKYLRPDDEKKNVVFKELKGGYVNLSYVLYPKNKIENAIVFRTFGAKSSENEINKLKDELNKIDLNNPNLNAKKEISSSDSHSQLFYDRETEALVMHSISQHGLCKPVYAKYLNGMCFGYAQGVTSSGPLMLTNDYLEEMSTKLAKFHSLKIELPENKFKTHYDKLVDEFKPSIQILIEMAIQKLDKINEFPYNQFPKLTEIIEEDKFMRTKFQEIGFGEIAFCHNDLNQKNIIWDPQNRELNFIDFEMSMNNYVACELGKLFFSFTGHFLDEFVEEFLPNDNYRLKFIRRYLEEKYNLKNEKPNAEIFEDEVQKLFLRSNISLLIFINYILLIVPFFDLRPDVFQVEESTKAKINLPYFCGRYGLKIWNFYLKIKDKFLDPVNEYLKKKTIKP